MRYRWVPVVLLGLLAACGPIKPPKPPEPPPAECLPGVAWCVAGQSCGMCKHNPTPDPGHCEMAPPCATPPPVEPPPVTPPPATGCAVDEAKLMWSTARPRP